MRYIYILIILLIFSSCTLGFEDINRSNKEIQKLDIEFFLATVQSELMDHYMSYDVNSNISLVQSQYFSQTDYTNESNFKYRYILSSIYTEKYYLVLSNLAEMTNILNNNLSLKSKSEIASWRLIISVLRAFCFQNITDAIGPCPFFDALDIQNNKTPAYDSQKVIYESLLEDLYTCTSSKELSMSLNLDHQDVIYNGDMDKWQKFANSMILRIAMRISDIEPNLSMLYVDRAVNENGGVFTSNSDNALFDYSNVEASNYLYINFQTWNIPIVASNTIYDIQKNNNDPRKHIYWSDSYWGDYGGGVYGESSDFWKVSILNPKYIEYAKIVSSAKAYSSYYKGRNDAPGIFLDYAEVEFFLSEAVLRGNYAVEGSVNQHFDKAVSASIYYHAQVVGIEKKNIYPLIEKYLENINFEKQENKIDIIAREKWLALFLQGPEAWAELRRLDAPKLNIPKGKTIHDLPTRMLFPSRENIVNKHNIEKAILMLSNKQDNVNTHLWWDIK